MERTIRIWLYNDYMEVTIEPQEDWSEDDLYEAAVSYVYDNISIEVT